MPGDLSVVPGDLRVMPCKALLGLHLHRYDLGRLLEDELDGFLNVHCH
jgi:hypothetical protein